MSLFTLNSVVVFFSVSFVYGDMLRRVSASADASSQRADRSDVFFLSRPTCLLTHTILGCFRMQRLAPGCLLASTVLSICSSSGLHLSKRTKQNIKAGSRTGQKALLTMSDLNLCPVACHTAACMHVAASGYQPVFAVLSYRCCSFAGQNVVEGLNSQTDCAIIIQCLICKTTPSTHACQAAPVTC